MGMMRIAGSCLLLWVSFGAPAQMHPVRWYFGSGAGLEIADGSATAIDGSPLGTDEGCASICGTDGNLLFFTNGERVYGSDLSVMPNGNGLAGHFSTAQSALIVPFIGEPGLYFVFTAPSQVASWSGIYSGLAYSVVDMSLNGGLGDVTLKNVELHEQTTEHLTAVRHANGRDVWVVTHGWWSDAFYAYLVTCTGIEGPVVSNAGEAITQDIWEQFIPAIGCMDIAGQGDRLAITWGAFASEDARAHLEVLSFDNTTGIVGGGFAVNDGGDPGQNLRGYGVQFSPDGTRLYWSIHGLLDGMAFTEVRQYDLTSADPPGTGTSVATGWSGIGTLQTGPDGMIYCAMLDGDMHVSRFTNPNGLGAASGFDADGISTAPNMVTWGLSNDWDTYPEEVDHGELIVPTDTLVCAGEAFDLDVTVIAPFEEPVYAWETGETTPVITIDDDGWYRVEVTLSCDVVLRDSIEVVFSSLRATLGPDRLACAGDSIELAGPGDATGYLWSTGETADRILVGCSGTYWLEVQDVLGCDVRDEVVLDFYDCTCPVFVPNTITPNGDLINDVFAVATACPLLSSKVTVHDRWGLELFSSTEAGATWPGDVPIGTYVWTFQYTWPDGEVVRRGEQRGHVTVVR